jgi:hypothetical protein
MVQLYFIMQTLAEFSCCLWKVEGVTKDNIPITPRASPSNSENWKEQQFQPIRNDEKLTLIRAAGGVYDFRNFKEIYLCKKWPSKFVYSSKNVSWVYLVKYFRVKKQRFRRVIGQYVPETASFFAVFGYFECLWRYIWTIHHHPRAGHSPCQWSAHQAVLERPTRSLALSKCRSGAADCCQGMTQSLPLSYWSLEKSYMTSSRTAT